jgi:glycosyltransferase involved in cell wall biosynthesis
MRILWFANTPCSASEVLCPGLNNGGWLSSLESSLSELPEIELHIAFYWHKEIPDFKYKGTNYYPIYRKRNRSKISRLIYRFLQQNSDKADLKNLKHLVHNINPDVIHVHGTEDNFGLIQKYCNIPVIISIQGILSSISAKYYSGIPTYAARIYEGILLKVTGNSSWITQKILEKKAKQEREILIATKYIIGRTDWDKRVTGLLSPNRVYFVGNEILRNNFYLNIWDKKNFENPIQLVSIMGNSIHKGLETIVKTAQLLSEYKTVNFKWTIIGDVSTLAKTTKRWLNINYQDLNIVFVGNKTENEIIDIFLKSDIFCQVSHIENSPNSLCEAMLTGMPIIATFAGGTESILENKKEGILVQEGDPFSYAGAIIELKTNINQAIEFAKSAREKALIRHDKKNITRTLVNTYHQVAVSKNSFKKD